MNEAKHDMESIFDAKALDTARRIAELYNVAYPGGEPQRLAAIQCAVHEAMLWAAPGAKQGPNRSAITRDELVKRFLTWPVPADVYPDGTPGQPGRTGTNLLTAEQAKQMLAHVLASDS